MKLSRTRLGAVVARIRGGTVEIAVVLKGLVDPKQSAPIIAAAKESSVESALAESYGAVDQGGPRPILVARKARERVAIRDVHDTDSVNMLWLLLPNDGYPS